MSVFFSARAASDGHAEIAYQRREARDNVIRPGLPCCGGSVEPVSSLKGARGGESERLRMLPPVTGSARAGASETAPCCSSCIVASLVADGLGAYEVAPPMALKLSPPACRSVYGFAVAAACFEYSLYSE